MGANKKGKYSFSLGANLQESPFQSDLSSLNEAVNSKELIDQNELKYSQQSIYALGSYHLNLGRWGFSSASSLSFLGQKLKEKINDFTQTQNNLIIEPSLVVRYKLDEVSSLISKISYNQNSLAENHLFNHQVLTNNRLTILNQPDLALQKVLGTGLHYRHHDMYNQFHLVLGLYYQKINGNYFSNLNIQENATQINYFFEAVDNDNVSFDFSTEKYISFIESLVKLSSNYSISNYKNILNNSELRNNQSHHFDTELSINTAFEGIFNFENIFNLNYNQSQNEGSATFSNTTLNNAFKIKCNASKSWFLSLSSAYYLPNAGNSSENFLFLDFSVRYRPLKKKYEWNLLINNLLNQDNFRQVQTSDYAINIFQSNLFPRYIFLNFSINF